MKLIIDELTDENRIDAYLADLMSDFSRSKIQSEIKKGGVLVNSKIVKPSYCIKEGDVITITVSKGKFIVLDDYTGLSYEEAEKKLKEIEEK